MNFRLKTLHFVLRIYHMDFIFVRNIQFENNIINNI
jgi:hypothetical protein